MSEQIFISSIITLAGTPQHQCSWYSLLTHIYMICMTCHKNNSLLLTPMTNDCIKDILEDSCDSVLWDMKPWCLLGRNLLLPTSGQYLERGGNWGLRNSGKFLPHYMASHLGTIVFMVTVVRTSDLTQLTFPGKLYNTSKESGHLCVKPELLWNFLYNTHIPYETLLNLQELFKQLITLSLPRLKHWM